MMALWSFVRSPAKGWCNKDGRTRTTLCSIGTERWPSHQLRFARCRLTCSRLCKAPRESPRRVAQSDLANKLSAKAEGIQEKFEREFWDEDLNSYVLALDGQKRPWPDRTSNAGQCLFCGIVSPEHARKLTSTLLGEELFCGWGIRTLDSREIRYNPMSYHNGSVLAALDNALVARGLARYGFKREAL